MTDDADNRTDKDGFHCRFVVVHRLLNRGKEQTMRCVDCEYHSVVANTHWCDATKKPKRISDDDAYKDAPCKRGKLKGADDE